jgi:hypothetical protein
MVVFGVLLAGANSATCAAQELRESYKALLSEKDHFNSNGQRLTSVAAIIRQDRANFNLYGLRDVADQDDVFFEEMNSRAALERMD